MIPAPAPGDTLHASHQVMTPSHLTNGIAPPRRGEAEGPAAVDPLCRQPVTEAVTNRASRKIASPAPMAERGFDGVA